MWICTIDKMNYRAYLSYHCFRWSPHEDEREWKRKDEKFAHFSLITALQSQIIYSHQFKSLDFLLWNFLFVTDRRSEQTCFSLLVQHVVESLIMQMRILLCICSFILNPDIPNSSFFLRELRTRVLWWYASASLDVLVDFEQSIIVNLQNL